MHTRSSAGAHALSAGLCSHRDTLWVHAHYVHVGHVPRGPCTLQPPAHATGTQRGDFPFVGLQGTPQYPLLEPLGVLPMDAATPPGWDVSLGDESSQQAP